MVKRLVKIVNNIFILVIVLRNLFFVWDDFYLKYRFFRGYDLFVEGF